MNKELSRGDDDRGAAARARIVRVEHGLDNPLRGSEDRVRLFGGRAFEHFSVIALSPPVTHGFGQGYGRDVSLPVGV